MSENLLKRYKKALHEQAVRPDHGGIYWSCHLCGTQWNKNFSSEYHKPKCLLNEVLILKE